MQGHGVVPGAARMSLSRAIALSRMGARLIAEDAERLEEEGRFDAVFCRACGVYFAAVTDPLDVMAKKSTDHLNGVHDILTAPAP